MPDAKGVAGCGQTHIYNGCHLGATREDRGFLKEIANEQQGYKAGDGGHCDGQWVGQGMFLPSVIG